MNNKQAIYIMKNEHKNYYKLTKLLIKKARKTERNRSKLNYYLWLVIFIHHQVNKEKVLKVMKMFHTLQKDLGRMFQYLINKGNYNSKILFKINIFFFYKYQNNTKL
jgi:hypothetical protein